MAILFITSTRVGDAILSTGVLAALMERYPDRPVTVACGPAAAPLFEALPRLDRIHVLDKMLWSLHWARLWTACVGRRWEVVADFRGSPMSYLLAARQRLRIVRGPADEHRVRQAARMLGLADDPPSPRLWTNAAHRATAARLIPPGPAVLAVGPTANWRAKTWRAERFAALIERLTAPTGILPGARVAVLGREDERPMALRLLESIPAARRLDLVGRLELPEAFACLQRCAFYVGNDSGLMHLAAASGIPTLGLFGPSNEALYAPWGRLTAVARTRVPYERIFPAEFDHRAADTLMDSLSVEDAEAAARALWQRAAERAA